MVKRSFFHRNAFWVSMLILWLGLAGSAACATEETSRWVLKFQDDFERTELGDDWHCPDGAIVNGRLLLGIRGTASALINRSFPGDVRLEFDTQAYEKRPPCDLSVTLAAERLRDFSWNYLFQLGGVNNSLHRIIGGRELHPVLQDITEPMIDSKRTYHVVATKEGRRLFLLLDGTLTLDATDEQVMGGTGFDAVGFVTWNGMYVDNVRVYERATPHPDTPQYVTRLTGLVIDRDEKGRLVATGDVSAGAQEGIAACNRGDWTAAEQAFKAESGEVRAAGLAWVYGQLDYDERPDDLPRVARLFAEVAGAHPEDRRLADYAWAAGQFGRVRVFPRDPYACAMLVYLGPEHNPFYDKALLYRARFLRANAQEGGDAASMKKANAMFQELLEKAPDNVVLRELCGEKIPWREDMIEQDPTVPRWAALLHEMYARQLTIMEWWFTKRQYEDGQLGGGWGDDVEILRSWGPFAMISDASPAVRNGIEKLCEGVWQHALVDGFCGDFGDVEHSAEPSADSIPTMLAIRYGDPLWFERNLASCRRIRDIYTGVDANGYIRFKSGWFGGDKVSSNLQHGGDNYYSVRAMKHLFWAAWYGNEEARQFYTNWAEGWVMATMTPKYTKPAGVPPANIWYPSGDIAPPNGASWTDPDYNIYGCCSIANFWIQDMFLAGYYLARQPLYLAPIHAWMNFRLTEPREGAPANPDIEKEPLDWAVKHARERWNTEATLVEYRWLTGDGSFDEIEGIERTPQRLHLPPTLEAFESRMEGALRQLRVNWNLHTREVLQTDRAGLDGSDASFGAFTGGVRRWGDAGVPTMAVTWDVPHSDFAALVVYCTSQHLRVWIYNAKRTPTRFGLRLWQLEPGEYDVHAGSLVPGMGFARTYHPAVAETYIHPARAHTYFIELPARAEWVVELRLRRPRPASVGPLPDLAVAERDIRANGDTVQVTVHNLGSAAATGVEVVLEQNGKAVARKTLENVPACERFAPSAVAVAFEGIPALGGLRLVVDPDAVIEEINESNNGASLVFRHPGGE